MEKEIEVRSWNVLEDVERDNRKLRRQLTRQRWFFRGVVATALVATVAIASHDRKTEDEEK